MCRHVGSPQWSQGRRRCLDVDPVLSGAVVCGPLDPRARPGDWSKGYGVPPAVGSHAVPQIGARCANHCEQCWLVSGNRVRCGWFWFTSMRDTMKAGAQAPQTGVACVPRAGSAYNEMVWGAHRVFLILCCVEGIGAVSDRTAACARSELRGMPHRMKQPTAPGDRGKGDRMTDADRPPRSRDVPLAGRSDCRATSRTCGAEQFVRATYQPPLTGRVVGG